MKTYANHCCLTRYYTLIIFLYIVVGIKAQFTIEDIPIPSTSGGGAMIGDIIHAENFSFVYSLDRLSIYDAQTNNYISEIPFPYQSNLIDEHNGKFNPIHFNELYNVPAANMMTYNPNANVLYVVTPELSILTIEVEYPDFTVISEYTPSSDTLPDYFKPLNGMNLIKFDHVHNRLYWVVTAKDINSPNNCIGKFHSMIRFFGLYKTDEHTGYITEYYIDSLATSDDYARASIFDIAFNHENDLYYLANMTLLSVYRVTDNGGTDKVQLVSEHYVDTLNYGGSLYKFGKLIYINETYPPNEKIHKIIALPYRYLTMACNNPDIFMLNGDLENPTAGDWKTFSSPSKRIQDGLFFSETKDLILCYSPNPDDLSPPPLPGEHTDIAVFSYDFNNSTFIEPPLRINSDSSINYSDIHDRNYSGHIHQVDASNLLVCKEDEIVKLTYTGNYNITTVLSAENNIFSKGVRNSTYNKSFIINTTANGLEVVDHNYGTSSIKTGYAVNHVVSDALGEKLYLFNKLNTYNTGCYIYEDGETYNINSPLETKISAPIGDCIYNPYLDDFIISENAYFTTQAARIKVFDNDISNTLIDTIPLIYEENQSVINSYYAKKMFLAPDEKLYVFANMRYDENENPRIFVLNANDNELGSAYQILYSFEIDNFPVPGGSYLNTFDFYNGYFCYNHYNQSVYATLSPNEFIYGPYSSVPNSMYEFHNLYSGPTGLLIKIEESGLDTYLMNYPGKIICPDNGGDPTNSQYYGKMFIIGRKFHIINTPFDEIIPSNTYEQVFNDIIYSAKHDQLFALRNAQGTCGPHRIIQILSLIDNDSLIVYDTLVEVGGQATCIFNNPYDGKIYFHQKYDEEKLGDVPVKLWSFDYDGGGSQNLSSVDLGFTSVYPDANHDGDKQLYLYNITTPAIDPYNNTIYIPNGGHSCVSKITFTPDESLPLNNETWAWFSVPRMERDYNDSVHIDIALSNDNLDAGQYIAETELQNIPLGALDPISNIYQGPLWSNSDPLQDIQSTLGYKIRFEYDTASGYEPPELRWLHMQGTVLNPDYGYVNLSEDPKENWLGYYLYMEQSPFDAISEDDLEHIYAIKGQYWACGKYWGEGIPEPYWICACHIGKSVRLNYGDMAVIKTYQPINDFRWQLNGTPITDNTDRPETENYTFAQQADYTPIFIELDSTVNPLEIGAFVEDTCIGATSVFQDDTLVLIPAYTEGFSGEIYFESYYGSNKSYVPPITEYYVQSQHHNQPEQRIIHTSENEDYYFVSFKNTRKKVISDRTSEPWIRFLPNPLRSDGTIKCFIPTDGMVEIILYNIRGKEQIKIHKGILNRGTHEFAFSGFDNSGKQLSNGTYVLLMKSAKWQAHTKVIVLR